MSSDQELTWLILNCMLYIILFFIKYYFSKNKFDIGNYVLVLWALSASFAIPFFMADYRHNTYDLITFFPLLYLFVLFLISVLPILNYNYQVAKYLSMGPSQ